jgi:hypothetical protein
MPARSWQRMPYHRCIPELVFEVVQEADGGLLRRGLTENIFTDGGTWDEWRKYVVEATTAFFFDRPRPRRIRLHLSATISCASHEVHRDVSGTRLADTLCRRWQYPKVRQVGSHIFWNV